MNRIATFYPEPHFTGYPFIVNGIFDTCYNFKGHVASFSLDPDTDSCELWGVEGCGEGATLISICFPGGMKEMDLARDGLEILVRVGFLSDSTFGTETDLDKQATFLTPQSLAWLLRTSLKSKRS